MEQHGGAVLFADRMESCAVDVVGAVMIGAESDLGEKNRRAEGERDEKPTSGRTIGSVLPNFLAMAVMVGKGSLG